MGQTLLLSTKQEEETKDEMLLALSRIASVSTSFPKKKKKKKKLVRAEPVEAPRFKSRFFFRPTPSIAQQVEEAKAAAEPHSDLEIINETIVDRSKSYSTELPGVLKSEIDKVREFWLQEMGPQLLGSNPGTLQALDVMQQTIDGPVTDPAFSQFEKMVEHARLFKMANFIVKHMGLPKAIVPDLIHSVQPRKEMMIVGPSYDDMGRTPRHARNEQAKQEGRRRKTEPDDEQD
jgi:hypothetical protein